MSLTLVPNFHLAPHVHVCRRGNHVVFLDLKKDRYMGLGASEVHAASCFVHELSELFSASDALPADAASMGNTALEQIRDEGLLQDLSGSSRQPAGTIAEPGSTLIEGYTEVPVTIGASHAVRFMRSCATAKWLLRWGSLHKAVLFVQRQRARCPGTIFDEDSARIQMARFNRLKPFVYSAQNACLFSSLVAFDYLRRFGIVTHFVFGVRTEPFSAHSWLQVGSVIVNDTAERAREHTPILVL